MVKGNSKGDHRKGPSGKMTKDIIIEIVTEAIEVSNKETGCEDTIERREGSQERGDL